MKAGTHIVKKGQNSNILRQKQEKMVEELLAVSKFPNQLSELLITTSTWDIQLER